MGSSRQIYDKTLFGRQLLVQTYHKNRHPNSSSGLADDTYGRSDKTSLLCLHSLNRVQRTHKNWETKSIVSSSRTEGQGVNKMNFELLYEIHIWKYFSQRYEWNPLCGSSNCYRVEIDTRCGTQWWSILRLYNNAGSTTKVTIIKWPNQYNIILIHQSTNSGTQQNSLRQFEAAFRPVILQVVLASAGICCKS
jgi:hypothetical protein